jgi:hypothetical protein
VSFTGVAACLDVGPMQHAWLRHVGSVDVTAAASVSDAGWPDGKRVAWEAGPAAQKEVIACAESDGLPGHLWRITSCQRLECGLIIAGAKRGACCGRRGVMLALQTSYVHPSEGV